MPKRGTMRAIAEARGLFEGERDEDEQSRVERGDAPTGLSGSRSSGSGRVPAEGSERRALGRLLSSAMALTAVWDGLFETTPTFDPKVSA